MNDDTPKASKSTLLKAANAARSRFVAAINELKKAGVSFIDRAPVVDGALLSNCKVFADRKALLATLPPGGVMAEIGVDKAEFSRFILDTLKPKVLHLFDVAPERMDPQNVSKAIESGEAVFHKGDSSTNISLFPDEFFDMIYVDGDHSYEGVVRDIVASEMKLKPGGHMVLNDYTAWSPSSMSRCGVAKAANEFVNSRRWPVTGIALQGAGYYDFAIRKPQR